jgi:hypothetical protein
MDNIGVNDKPAGQKYSLESLKEAIAAEMIGYLQYYFYESLF